VATQLSSRLPGFDVASAQDVSWGGHYLTLLSLDAKLSHMGADVDGLAYRPH
jgi:hypothetical protein